MLLKLHYCHAIPSLFLSLTSSFIKYYVMDFEFKLFRKMKPQAFGQSFTFSPVIYKTAKKRGGGFIQISYWEY